MNTSKKFEIETKLQPLKNSQVLCVFMEGALILDHTVSANAQVMDNIGESIHALIVDLSKVNFIDSSGLGLLASWAIKLPRRNVTMVLTGVSEKTEHLINETNLTNLFFTLENQEQAMIFLSEQV